MIDTPFGIFPFLKLGFRSPMFLMAKHALHICDYRCKSTNIGLLIFEMTGKEWVRGEGKALLRLVNTSLDLDPASVSLISQYLGSTQCCWTHDVYMGSIGS